MVYAVLVIAPHPDDEAIGCGGAICLHRERADHVHAVFLTSGERGIAGSTDDAARATREGEAEAAAEVLQLDNLSFLRLPDLGVGQDIGRGAARLREILEKDTPDLIYLPHPAETHPDHQASLPLVRTALSDLHGDRMPELRAYEVWTPMATYDWPEDISRVVRRKLRAVRCYRSQLELFRYDRAIRGLNQYRGCLAAQSRYAEVFRYIGYP